VVGVDASAVIVIYLVLSHNIYLHEPLTYSSSNNNEWRRWVLRIG